MQGQVTKLLLWLLGAFAVFATCYTARWHWLRRKYGCGRCYYRRRFRDDNGNAREFCSASCGNNEGKVCGAWYYRYHEKARDDIS